MQINKQGKKDSGVKNEELNLSYSDINLAIKGKPFDKGGSNYSLHIAKLDFKVKPDPLNEKLYQIRFYDNNTFWMGHLLAEKFSNGILIDKEYNSYCGTWVNERKEGEFLTKKFGKKEILEIKFKEDKDIGN